jgi:hypothetical protein
VCVFLRGFALGRGLSIKRLQQPLLIVGKQNKKTPTRPGVLRSLALCIRCGVKGIERTGKKGADPCLGTPRREEKKKKKRKATSFIKTPKKGEGKKKKVNAEKWGG